MIGVKPVDDVTHLVRKKVCESVFVRHIRVLTALENMEISGNLLILENSGNLKYN